MKTPYSKKALQMVRMLLLLAPLGVVAALPPVTVPKISLGGGVEPTGACLATPQRSVSMGGATPGAVKPAGKRPAESTPAGENLRLRLEVQELQERVHQMEEQQIEAATAAKALGGTTPGRHALKTVGAIPCTVARTVPGCPRTLGAPSRAPCSVLRAPCNTRVSDRVRCVCMYR